MPGKLTIWILASQRRNLMRTSDPLLFILWEHWLQHQHWSQLWQKGSIPQVTRFQTIQDIVRATTMKHTPKPMQCSELAYTDIILKSLPSSPAHTTHSVGPPVLMCNSCALQMQGQTLDSLAPPQLLTIWPAIPLGNPAVTQDLVFLPAMKYYAVTTRFPDQDIIPLCHVLML